MFMELECTTQLVSQRGVAMRVSRFGDAAAEAPERPQLHWIELLDERAVIPAHYHKQDRFQVFVDSSGSIGSRSLSALTVHYADRYTPYGAIRAEHAGLRFLTARACHDKAIHYIADREARAHRQRRGGRQFSIDLEASPHSSGGAVELIHEEADGVSVHRVTAASDGVVPLPLQCGDGPLVCVVLSGAFACRGRLYRRSSYIASFAGKVLPPIQATQRGVALLVLGFRPWADKGPFIP